jgi:hypothetical protein
MPVFSDLNPASHLRLPRRPVHGRAHADAGRNVVVLAELELKFESFAESGYESRRLAAPKKLHPSNFTPSEEKTCHWPERASVHSTKKCLTIRSKRRRLQYSLYLI